MKLIFAGTPAFASRALQAIHDAGHDIALVLTRPDQPAGRGQRTQTSEVKQLAQSLHLKLAQPPTLRDAATQSVLRDVGADVMVVAAYGLILPQAVLELPRLGCINIHASLLPRWRGAAPIQRAIEAGDARTGITIMQMDAGLDTGPVLLSCDLAIAPDDTAVSLHRRMAELGAQAITGALSLLADPARGLVARPQTAAGATYAAKVEKSEAALDWRQSAAVLAAKVRAFNPFPVATCVHAPAGSGGPRRAGQPVTLRVWAASAAPAAAAPTEHGAARAAVASGDGVAPAASVAPGTILSASAEGIAVMCSEGVLTITKIQRSGGSVLDAKEFLRGYNMAVGDRMRAPVVTTE